MVKHNLCTNIMYKFCVSYAMNLCRDNTNIHMILAWFMQWSSIIYVRYCSSTKPSWRQIVHGRGLVASVVWGLRDGTKRPGFESWSRHELFADTSTCRMLSQLTWEWCEAMLSSARPSLRGRTLAYNLVLKSVESKHKFTVIFHIWKQNLCK